MSTCAELPQLGCCDDDPIVGLGENLLFVDHVVPGMDSLSIEGALAILKTLQLLLAAVPFTDPAFLGVGSLVRLFRYENGVIVEPGLRAGGTIRDERRDVYGYAQMQSSLGFVRSPLFAAWRFSVTRKIAILPKVVPVGVFTRPTSLPACVFHEFGPDPPGQIWECLAPRSTALDFRFIEDSALYLYKVEDQGDRVFLESSGADIRKLAVQTGTGANGLLYGGVLQSIATFLYDGRPPRLPEGFCCDLSPLAP